MLTPPTCIHKLDSWNHCAQYYITHNYCYLNAIASRIDDLDTDLRALQRKRSSVEFSPYDAHVLPTTLEAPVPRTQSTGVFSAVRRFSPVESRKQSDSTNISDELHSKKASGLFGRNYGGGGGVPKQVDRPRFSLTQQRHLTLRSSSSLGESAFDDSNVREVSCLSYSQVHALKRTIDHPVWKTTSLVLILLILFGPAIRDMWLPKTADYFVDGMFTVAFAFLVVDIIIRSVVDRAYFSWNVKTHNLPEKNCRVGSFMFWIDTVRLHFLIIQSLGLWQYCVFSHFVITSLFLVKDCTDANSVRDFVH